MLYTLVEPHRGHEVAYNRWYERDHFYAGCQIGAYNFAGARFVATAPLKELRYPRGDGALVADPAVGSYLGIYYVLDGHHDEWNRWAVDQVNVLHAAGRMFEQRDHVHTGLYRFEWEHRRDADGVPAELTLDHRFPGMVSVHLEPAAGTTGAELAEWVRGSTSRRSLEGSPVATVLGFSPLPLLADAPGDVPRGDAADERVLLLCFVDEVPDGHLRRGVRPARRRRGRGRGGLVLWASAFSARCRAPTRTRTSCGRTADARPPAATAAVPPDHRHDPFDRTSDARQERRRAWRDRMAERAAARGWVFAPTLWELIEARAAATPETLLAHEDTGRELTFAGYRDACLRAAAGLYADHGVRRAPASAGSCPPGTSPWCWWGPWPGSGPARTR